MNFAVENGYLHFRSLYLLNAKSYRADQKRFWKSLNYSLKGSMIKWQLKIVRFCLFVSQVVSIKASLVSHPMKASLVSHLMEQSLLSHLTRQSSFPPNEAESSIPPYEGESSIPPNEGESSIIINEGESINPPNLSLVSHRMRASLVSLPNHAYLNALMRGR